MSPYVQKATKTIFVDLFKSVDKATNRFHDFLLAYTSSTSSSRNNEWTNTLLPVFTEPTRPSPHWPWGSSVKIKSPLPCSPLRRGVNPYHPFPPPTINLFLLCCSYHLSHCVITPFLHLSLTDTSTTLVVCCQVPSKWTAIPCSCTKSSFLHYQTSRQEEVSFIGCIFFKW